MKAASDTTASNAALTITPPRPRPSLQASYSSGSLSESDDSVSTPRKNQIVARSAQGAVFFLFNHQAGGHKPFLRTADGQVCKPAIPLELQFYEALDEQFPQLKPFVPPFVGVVSVELSFPSTSTGSTSTTTPTGSSDNDTPPLVARSPSVGDLTQLVADRNSSLKSPFLVAPTTAALLPATAHGKKRRLSKHAGVYANTRSGSGGASPGGYSAKLWRKERTKRSAANNSSIVRSNSTGQLKDYLVLADLTQQYTRPCVLDIKMGTRQHGEDATPAKALSHTAKCEATTSAALGLRICGMQVYNVVDAKYTLWDKHWGRKLTPNGIEPALKTYLSNGAVVRYDVVASLLAKVEALQHVLTATHGLRFWGSSLLLIYEGEATATPATATAAARADVYLIDFAHCQMSATLDSADSGLVLGLTNLALALRSLLVAPQSGVDTNANTSDDRRH